MGRLAALAVFAGCLASACGQVQVASPPDPEFTRGSQAAPTIITAAPGGTEGDLIVPSDIEADVDTLEGTFDVGRMVLVDDAGAAVPDPAPLGGLRRRTRAPSGRQPGVRRRGDDRRSAGSPRRPRRPRRRRRDGRGRRPVQDRQHLEDDHGDRDHAARRGRGAHPRRTRRLGGGRAPRCGRTRCRRGVDHGARTAQPHRRLPQAPEHVLRNRGGLVLRRGAGGGCRPTSRRAAATATATWGTACSAS